MSTPLEYQYPKYGIAYLVNHYIEPAAMQGNYICVYTSSVGTQTDPEVFYVNGKPARAVQPFRVVPKPKTPPTDTPAQQGQTQPEVEQVEPHTSGWQQAEWFQSEQTQHDMHQLTELQPSEIQLTQEQMFEYQQQQELQIRAQLDEQFEQEIQERQWQEIENRRMPTQETQTDMQYLNHQFSYNNNYDSDAPADQ